MELFFGFLARCSKDTLSYLVADIMFQKKCTYVSSNIFTNYKLFQNLNSNSIHQLTSCFRTYIVLSIFKNILRPKHLFAKNIQCNLDYLSKNWKHLFTKKIQSRVFKNCNYHGNNLKIAKYTKIIVSFTWRSL